MHSDIGESASPAVLQIWKHSTAGTALILTLQSAEHTSHLGELEALLRQLPFEMGSIKLGPTWMEMGNSDVIVESCSSTTEILWRGRTLIVQDEDGGPGDGSAISALWREFVEKVASLYGREFSPTAFQPCLPLEKASGHADASEQAAFCAAMCPDQELRTTLQIWKYNAAGKSLVLELLTPRDESALTEAEPLLRQFPFSDGSLKLGPTMVEIGTSATFTATRSGGITEVRWKDKLLFVQEEDGCPGDGDAISQLWHKFEEKIAPFYGTN